MDRREPAARRGQARPAPRAGGRSAASRRGEEETARPLLDALGDVVFWLVIVVFLPAVLGALALEGLLTPVQGTIDQVLGFRPNIFAVALILIVGWLVARIVRRIVTALLTGIGSLMSVKRHELAISIGRVGRGMNALAD